MAQPACFITGPALQFGVAQMSFLTQLCIDHVLLADRKTCSLGDLQQIFEVDPLACPSCHGAMRIVAVITQTSVIDQILTHRRTRAAREAHAGPRSPPSTRAPASRGATRAPRPFADAPPVTTSTRFTKA